MCDDNFLATRDRYIELYRHPEAIMVSPLIGISPRTSKWLETALRLLVFPDYQRFFSVQRRHVWLPGWEVYVKHYAENVLIQDKSSD